MSAFFRVMDGGLITRKPTPYNPKHLRKSQRQPFFRSDSLLLLTLLSLPSINTPSGMTPIL